MKVGTFFSGVGSPEQALRNLGIEHKIEFACDIDKYAKETYLKNFKPKLFAEDITTLDMEDLPYVDLLVFGFPCQAFSMAGKREGFDDTRGTLFYDALRYLKEHKPRYFIAENVKGLLSHDNSKTFQTIIDCLAKTTNYQMSLMPFENLDYHIHYKVLNTKDFGLPQNRERIFIVGIRDDEDNNFNFPKEIQLELKLKDFLQDKVNEKYYLSYKAVKGIENSTYGRKKHIVQKSNSITNHNLNSIFQVGNIVDTGNFDNPQRGRIYDPNGISPALNTCSGGGHEPKIILDTGNNPAIEYKSVAIKDKNRAKHQREKNKEYGDYAKDYQIEERKDDVSYCVKEATREFMIKNQTNKTIRRLTPLECERLQGFPDNFTEGVSDTQRYKQMGNTISVPVIQAIIKKLIE